MCVLSDRATLELACLSFSHWLNRPELRAIWKEFHISSDILPGMRNRGLQAADQLGPGREGGRERERGREREIVRERESEEREGGGVERQGKKNEIRKERCK